MKISTDVICLLLLAVFLVDNQTIEYDGFIETSNFLNNCKGNCFCLDLTVDSSTQSLIRHINSSLKDHLTMYPEWDWVYTH